MMHMMWCFSRAEKIRLEEDVRGLYTLCIKKEGYTKVSISSVNLQVIVLHIKPAFAERFLW